MATSKFSEVDEYGFKRPEDFDYENYEKIMNKYYMVLANRSKKWDNYLKNKPKLFKNNSGKLKRYIRKGIPAHLRGEVWMHISGAFVLQQKSPNLYRDLLKLKFEPDIVESIKIDLPRTFPDNIFFENHDIRLQLYHVLVAYAHHNKEVGYCQGLNYIAGLILIVTKNDEWTFWLLKIILDNIVSSYHTKTMYGLKVDTAVLRELIVLRVPEVNKRLEDLGLPCAVISTKWLICLFAEVLPTETVLRVWDCIFHEGYKILFRVSLTLLISYQNEINSADDITSLADVLRDMVKSTMVMNCHEFIDNCFKQSGPLRRRDIEKMRMNAAKEINAAAAV